MSRFEREKKARGRVMPRDLQVVLHTFYARWLDNRMIGQMEFGSVNASRCRDRIRKLYDWGYLNKRKTYPNERDIYFLGLKGRRYVARMTEYPAELVDKIAGVEGDTQAPLLMMNHELTLSQLYVTAVLTCRAHGWSLFWKNARMLELEKLGVQPDGYLRVAGAQTTEEAYVEFTAVLPERDVLFARLDAYRQLWERIDRIVPVLWLTTTESKANRIWGVTRQFVYRDYVYLGLVQNASRFMTGRIRRWSEASEPVAWINGGEKVLFDASLAPTGGLS